jgi:hypothetical protein
MSASDYLPAAKRSRAVLDEPVPAIPWDPDLARRMKECRRIVFEEDVAGDLLQLLAAAGP